MTNTIKFSFSNVTLDLEANDHVFKPTTVTKLVGDKIEQIENKRILDLGCGIGPLAIYFAKNQAAHVVGLDIVPEEIDLAVINSKNNGVSDKCEFKHSNLFSSLDTEEKFDIIVSDVSGLADKIAAITPWYPKNVPNGGPTGTEIIVEAVRQSKNYLKPGGVFYCAVLSLSDVNLIDSAFKEMYNKNYSVFFEKDILFCDELYKNCDMLKDYGIKEIRNRKFWTFYLYRGINE